MLSSCTNAWNDLLILSNFLPKLTYFTDAGREKISRRPSEIRQGSDLCGAMLTEAFDNWVKWSYLCPMLFTLFEPSGMHKTRVHFNRDSRWGARHPFILVHSSSGWEFHRWRRSNKILSKEIISIRSLVLLWHARVHAPTIFWSVARAMVQASSRVSTCRVRMPSSVVSSIIIPSWIPIRVEFIVQNRNNGTSEQGHEKHSPSWFLWLHFPKA